MNVPKIRVFALELPILCAKHAMHVINLTKFHSDHQPSASSAKLLKNRCDSLELPVYTTKILTVTVISDGNPSHQKT